MFEKKKKNEEEQKPVFNAENDNSRTLNASLGDTVTVSITNPNAQANQKVQARKRHAFAFKVVLSILVIASVAYATYAIISFIRTSVNQSSEKESYLTLSGKNYAESKVVYDSFGKENSAISFKNSIKDYAFISNHLFLSTHKITPESFVNEEKDFSSLVPQNYEGYALYNVTDNVSYSTALSTDYENGIYSIDLSKCQAGDYLIYPYNDDTSLSKESIYPVSIHSSDAIRETFYTLPNSNKQRKRIVFKNNSASPYTLISITDSGDKLPDGYYDAVILNQEFTESESGLVDNGSSNDEETKLLSDAVQSINNEYVYKVTYAKDIKEANSIKASISIALSNDIDANYTSVYLPKNGYESKVLPSSSILQGYDYYPEVRELTGYLDNAGNGYSGVIGNDLLSLSNSVYGKEAYLVKIQDSIVATVKSILEA